MVIRQYLFYFLKKKKEVRMKIQVLIYGPPKQTD